jgi:hypothetical protein
MPARLIRDIDENLVTSDMMRLERFDGDAEVDSPGVVDDNVSRNANGLVVLLREPQVRVVQGRRQRPELAGNKFVRSSPFGSPQTREAAPFQSFVYPSPRFIVRRRANEKDDLPNVVPKHQLIENVCSERPRRTGQNLKLMRR